MYPSIKELIFKNQFDKTKIKKKVPFAEKKDRGGKLYAGATSVEKVVFHALTQLRLARSHARPNRIRFPVWGKPKGLTLPQSSDDIVRLKLFSPGLWTKCHI